MFNTNYFNREENFFESCEWSFSLREARQLQHPRVVNYRDCLYHGDEPKWLQRVLEAKEADMSKQVSFSFNSEQPLFQAPEPSGCFGWRRILSKILGNDESHPIAIAYKHLPFEEMKELETAAAMARELDKIQKCQAHFKHAWSPTGG